MKMKLMMMIRERDDIVAKPQYQVIEGSSGSVCPRNNGVLTIESTIEHKLDGLQLGLDHVQYVYWNELYNILQLCE